ncbi:MAG: glycosyltransferase family 4 protein [Defluviicoccus sp.]|nr:MAG: glycosyltransferase family 4 protein [Defluviicoccus sp.]
MSDTLRIVHVVRQYDPMQGGIESYVKALCAQQRRQGLDPSVLTLNRIFHKPQTRLPEREVIDGLVVQRIPFRGNRRLIVPFFNPMGLRDYDLVHMHAIDQLCDMVCASQFMFRRPIVVTTHGGFFHTPALAMIKRIYFQTISRLTLNRASAVIACSSSDQQMMRRIGIEATLIPNAVVSWGEMATGPDLIYIGRLAVNKQVEKLIDFAGALRRRGCPRRLHIVGDDFDQMTPALVARIRQHGVADDVVLHGYLSRDDVQALLRQCRFFVSASRYEGFGMSMIEAMSAGLIPFVQVNDSFSELIGQTRPHSLTDFADPDRAAEQFVRLEDSVTEEDQQQVRAFALQFSWPELANKVLLIYQKLLSGHRRSLAARLAAAQERSAC